MIITFFGHATYQYDENDEKKLMELIESVSRSEKVDFYLGGYGNFDSLAKKCAQRYKEKHRNSRIIFVTPYLNKWLDIRKEYIERNYDEIIYPELEQVPLKFAILKRNEWMIDLADHVFVFVKTHYGGAYKALIYAKKHRKAFTNIYSGEYDLF